jgi:hypothetical protein
MNDDDLTSDNDLWKETKLQNVKWNTQKKDR